MIEQLEPLLALLEVRLASGQAYSEYELLRWLQEPEQCIFPRQALAEPQSLFQSHFLLMHALYWLQQQWHRQHSALLEISALHIQKKPWPGLSARNDISTHDPLANYYLDLQNFATSEQEIETMLRHFWQRMLQPECQQQDLDLLEIQPPISYKIIQQQYRKLAMQHHPDRGGEQQKFCAIQAAFQRLKGQYQCD